MTTTQDQPLNISELSVSNKEKHLTIMHNMTMITKGAKMLNLPGVIYPGDQPVHNDLLEILQQIVPHFLMIIEVPGYKLGKPNYLTDKTALADEKLKGYYVSGFSISSKGMLTLKGGIKTEGGRVTSMNAPVVSTSLDDNNYAYIEHLVGLIEAAKHEGNYYFIDGKFGDNAQPGLFDVAAKQGEEQNA